MLMIMPCLALVHGRHDRVHAIKGTIQIRSDQLLPVLNAELGKGTIFNVQSRIVDKDVHRAKSLDNSGNQFLNLLGITDVGCMGHHVFLVAKLFSRLLQLFSGAAG